MQTPVFPLALNFLFFFFFFFLATNAQGIRRSFEWKCKHGEHIQQWAWLSSHQQLNGVLSWTFHLLVSGHAIIKITKTKTQKKSNQNKLLEAYLLFWTRLFSFLLIFSKPFHMKGRDEEEQTFKLGQIFLVAVQCGIEARHFARIVGIETKPILVISLRCHLGVGWGLRTRLSTICFLPPHRKRSTRENGNNFKHSAKTDTLACCCCCCSQWPISTLRSMRNTGKWSENSWPTSGIANKQENKKTHGNTRHSARTFKQVYPGTLVSCLPLWRPSRHQLESAGSNYAVHIIHTHTGFLSFSLSTHWYINTGSGLEI